MKRCTKCQIEKHECEFYPQKGGKGGRHSRCIACESARGKARYADVSQSGEYMARHRHNNIFRKFGVTQEDYDAMLEIQGGRCGICGSTDLGSARTKHFAIDHDHVTGKVRGLLCNRCNQALGLFGDNPDVLLKAAEYLDRHHGRKPVR